ncbi:MAG: TonB-dependent receptor, partial [Armatimonadetes bacterium]|nr:TonB-dependent receptor [Armatimonadota bacterium]
MAGAAAALAVVLAPVPSGARAQVPVFELDEVIVPGKRPQVRGTSPASVSVITAAEMERLGARTVGDALAHLPEVTVLSYGSYGALNTLSIRGAGATQVLVLLDGMPVTGLLTGTVDLRTLPVEGVERIEVLRGPFSALHGSGALGGVVNIVSRTRVAPRLSGSYGSFDTAGAAVHYGTTDAAQRRGAGIIGRLDRSSGARPNSGLDSRHAALRLFDGALALRLRAYTAQVGVPGDAVCPTPSARQDDDRTILDLTWRPPDGRRSFTLYWRDERTAYTDPAGSTCFAFPSTSRTTGGVLGLQWQSLLAQRGGHVVVGGVEAEALRLTSTLSGVGERTATTGAIYLA